MSLPRTHSAAQTGYPISVIMVTSRRTGKGACSPEVRPGTLSR